MSSFWKKLNDVDLHSAVKEIFPLITALGLGPLFQVCLRETAKYFSTLTLGFVGAAYSTSGCYAVEGHGGVNFDLWLPQVLNSCVYVYSKFIDALCRSLGGTVGISIGQAIYSSVGHLNLGMNQNSMLYFSRY